MTERHTIPDVPTAVAALRTLTMTEIHALAAIKAVGTLSAGAKRLSIAQPTMSEHIRRIERKLGVTLFSRHRRGVDVTPSGMVLLRLAAAWQTDMTWAAEELLAAAQDAQRPIRVGSMALTAGGFAALALGRLATLPNAPATVLIEGTRDVLLEHLRRARIDLFIGRLPEDAHTTDLIREVLFLDSAVIIASTHHPLARKPKVSIRQLTSQAWVLPGDDTSFREQLDWAFRQSPWQLPRPRISVYSMLAIPAIVATSNLIGFLPASFYGAGTLSSGLQHLDVPLNRMASTVGILMRKDADVAQHLQGLLDILRNVAASARNALALG